jgi:hypothetical protein
MSNFDFWATKHAIDDEVARVGWFKEKCIIHIKQRYHTRSRLSMTDEQLLHFLEHLRSLPSRKTSTQKLRTRSRRDKHRY